MAPTPPRIAIIGGGMAGLVALAVLEKHGVPATLYERDTSASARSHLGGTLDMHEESGMAAIKEVGLHDKLMALVRPGATGEKICEKLGNFLWEDDGEGPGPPPRPEVDRTALRQLFIDVVDPASIKWDHAFVSAEPVDAAGTHKVTFANGTSIECDVLLGADGTHSRVRPLLSSAKPFFTGITGAEMSLAPPTVATETALSDLLGGGMMCALGDRKALISQRNGDSRIRIYAYFYESVDWTLPKDPDEGKAALLTQFTGWAPWLESLIFLADPKAIYARPLWILPIGHKWESKPGVTLLGDAAHVMSPFAGEGANQAMQDGLEVALALAGSKSLEECNKALSKFEKEMFERVTPFAQESANNLEEFFAEDAAQKVAHMFASHGPPPE